ncbi:MAG: GNAT family protein [Opitutaceae bacterium]
MHPATPLEPVILTDGPVRLEPLAAVHVDGLMRAGAEPSIWTYLPEVRYRTRSDFERLVAEADRDRRAGLSLPFAIVRSEKGVDAVVGTTRYMDIRLRDRGLEIGWTFLDPAHQRTDVNTRCKRLLLGHAFERLGMIRVQLKTDLRNIRSQRAIERLGARREGVLRQHMICADGHIRDTVYFSVIAKEWPLVREGLDRRLARSPPPPVDTALPLSP